MKYLLHTIIGTLLGAGIATAVPATAGIEATHEVPEWMTRVCPTEDSVNCWYDGGTHGDTGPIYVRLMPGRAHMVCVMYADHPRRDYCERTR